MGKLQCTGWITGCTLRISHAEGDDGRNQRHMQVDGLGIVKERRWYKQRPSEGGEVTERLTLSSKTTEAVCSRKHQGVCHTQGARDCSTHSGSPAGRGGVAKRQ